MGKPLKKLLPFEVAYILRRFGRIDTGNKCPKCMALVYYNKAGQKWCTTCDWSNDHKLSASLRRMIK